MDPLLTAYDAQLRTAAEVVGADSVTRLGPLWLATLPGARGFITYRDLAGAVPAELVRGALDHFARDTAVTEVEWKTRGHDHAPGLAEALLAAGFTAGDPESIMIGEARLLALDVELPAGVTLRSVTTKDDVFAAATMQDEVFGSHRAAQMAATFLRRLADRDGSQLWVAEADGRVVSAGRLEPVSDSDFAGIWGGATRPDWRGRGIYRALTAARARAALDLGRTLINSDSTEFSRPILQRSDLHRVSSTTPYSWRRDQL